AGSEGRVRSLERRLLRGVVGVVQHVEHHDRIGRRVVYVTDISQDDVCPRAERGPRALDLARIDLDPEEGLRLRRRGPAPRPSAGGALGAGREQPGSQQSLAATEIEHTGAPGEEPVGEQGGEYR